MKYKYIRTEDGVYEYVDYDNECIIPMPIIKYKERLTHCAECDIIKQADTIEDLCDETIFILEDSSIPFSRPYQYDKERLMEWFKIETEIDIGFGFTKKIKEKFLAIWTKGKHGEPILKSAARMKGILPNGEIDWELL